MRLDYEHMTVEVRELEPDPEKTSEDVARSIAAVFLRAIERAMQDPAFMAEFERWKGGEKQRECKESRERKAGTPGDPAQAQDRHSSR